MLYTRLPDAHYSLVLAGVTFLSKVTEEMQDCGKIAQRHHLVHGICAHFIFAFCYLLLIYKCCGIYAQWCSNYKLQKNDQQHRKPLHTHTHIHIYKSLINFHFWWFMDRTAISFSHLHVRMNGVQQDILSTPITTYSRT